MRGLWLLGFLVILIGYNWLKYSPQIHRLKMTSPQPLSKGEGQEKTSSVLRTPSPKEKEKKETITINNVLVDVLTPVGEIKGDILVLPGWNFNRKLWCDSSSLCTKALAKGYRLVMPEMGKSIYSSQYFPETRKDWRHEPTINWITDSLLPEMKRRKVFITKNNFLLGLSTGARGVVLIAEKTKNFFAAGAALSGDYNPTTMTTDNLIKGYYGSYEKFPLRWKNIDNATTDLKKLNIPIYFGHGTNDKVVPPNQTKDFYTLLQKENPNPKTKLNMPKAGHNFKYWDAEVEHVLGYFDGVRGSK
ncbi:MAG: alpha/beta hydrolase [Bacteroidetes bacterium]|nr:alpha/beta hydrolase [Bacteroidota bacterium]